MDTRKRTPAEQRFCWFTGRDETADQIALFSQYSTDDVASLIVPARAVATTGTELERGLAGEIWIYVVWSRKDRALATALRDQLDTYLSTSRSRRYQTWDRSQIEAGERREAVIDRERRRTELVLVLVSPNLLADPDAKDDLAAFQQTDTSILPVTLKRVAPEQDQRGLESRAWFPGNDAPSYADLRPKDRAHFAQKLFLRLEARWDRRRPESEALAEMLLGERLDDKVHDPFVRTRIVSISLRDADPTRTELERIES